MNGKDNTSALYPPQDSWPEIRLSNVISALSFALDLTEGQPMGHAVNCCLLGTRVAEIIGLPESARNDLYYALLLKDAGCSSNAARMYEIFGGDEIQAKREVKTQDWTRVNFEGLNYLLRNVKPNGSAMDRMRSLANIVAHRKDQADELMHLRCDRGSQIALKLGFPISVAEAIRALDEHWNGKGGPEGISGEQIPLFARIMSICQTLEVFAALNGREEAFAVIEERSGAWFDPELVRVAQELRHDEEFWKHLQDGSAQRLAIEAEPASSAVITSDEQLDNICDAFAEVVDAKSPFTHRHSQGVTHVAAALGTKLGLAAKTMTMLRRAALLHDIGKLSVPNSILDKPGPLTAQEWEVVRLHPYYTQRILEKVQGFEHLAYVASTHHERLDGSGYYRNLRSSQLPLQARVLTMADMWDALTADRPYRAGMPVEKALAIVAKDVPHALDADCLDALLEIVPNLSANNLLRQDDQPAPARPVQSPR
jgi:HD-GYP domain-containing protein (c-di-GMP phosphodiesterase class II)